MRFIHVIGFTYCGRRYYFSTCNPLYWIIRPALFFLFAILLQLVVSVVLYIFIFIFIYIYSELSLLEIFFYFRSHGRSFSKGGWPYVGSSVGTGSRKAYVGSNPTWLHGHYLPWWKNLSPYMRIYLYKIAWRWQLFHTNSMSNSSDWFCYVIVLIQCLYIFFTLRCLNYSLVFYCSRQTWSWSRFGSCTPLANWLLRTGGLTSLHILDGIML